MSTPNHDCLDAETILNDLCASKINASISLIGMADSILSLVIRRRPGLGFLNHRRGRHLPQRRSMRLLPGQRLRAEIWRIRLRSSVAEGEVTTTSLVLTLPPAGFFHAQAVLCCRAGRLLSRRHSRLSRSILFCRILVIGLTLALPACTDFKKDFLCRPDGHCVNAQPFHTPTQ
jgi:hypothetical protein